MSPHEKVISPKTAMQSEAAANLEIIKKGNVTNFVFPFSSSFNLNILSYAGPRMTCMMLMKRRAVGRLGREVAAWG